MINERNSIQVLKGIGEKKAETYKKLGINRISDLLHFFPSNYGDRGELIDINDKMPETKILTKGVCNGHGINRFIKKNFSMTILPFCSGSTCFRVIFYNQPYRKNQFKPDHEYVLYGAVSTKNGVLSISSPDAVPIERANELQQGVYPIYAIPQNIRISQSELKKHIHQALTQTAVKETIPNWIKQEAGIPSRPNAYKMIHQPADHQEAELALRYIRFFDFLMFHLRFASIESPIETAGIPYTRTDTDTLIRNLPFSLTESQKNAVDQIVTDVKSGEKMNRLLQGDVGSGKTAVAMCAAYLAASNSSQCAIAAPTEILAKQHYNTYQPIFEKIGIQTVILYSSLNTKERKETLKKIRSGEASIIFGTHAVFSEDVLYQNLSLAIIDEQHRFGVMQRAKLEQKGNDPHLLVMSATPIPRTLALSIYKNLSVSVLNEVPKGRLPVKTQIISSAKQANAINLIRKELVAEHKAFIVCPAIEEESLSNVNDVYKEMKALFRQENTEVGFITGKMNEHEKTTAMQMFADGKTKILIATTVVEVGVDIPEATVIWIKNSERYGLAQLHQLRGRVGRSKLQSYCLLETDSLSDTVKKRLSILTKTTDGFRIAQEDLHIRGCGELLGYRQSGKNQTIIYDAIQFEDLFLKADAICTKLIQSQKSEDINYLSMFQKKLSQEPIILN